MIVLQGHLQMQYLMLLISLYQSLKSVKSPNPGGHLNHLSAAKISIEFSYKGLNPFLKAGKQGMKQGSIQAFDCLEEQSRVNVRNAGINSTSKVWPAAKEGWELFACIYGYPQIY